MTFMDNERNKSDTADAFWDLDSIVPKKRGPSAFEKSHTEAVEIDIPTNNDTSNKNDGCEKIPENGTITRYIHPHTDRSERKTQPDEEYTPERSLIHSVRLYSWTSPYPYYEPFRKYALYYYNKSVGQVQEKPFFSYMPQYSQLTDSQLAFYIWLRGEIREGRYPSADYSYLLLLIYETINLSDKVPIDISVDILVRVWLNYREDYPRLDVQLSEWIFDMCLIGKLPPPRDCLRIAGKALPNTAGLREFYADALGDGDAFAELLLSYCSNYDYRKSKFAKGEDLPIYDKHMKGVLAFIISQCSDPSHPFELAGFRMQDSKTKRDAYTGALCSPKVKRRIEFDYCSFSHSHELRFVVTDVLKYAENKIRAYLGIKSRLTVSSISEGIKSLADAYFNENLPNPIRTTTKEQANNEYEKLYEPATSGLSFESASKIEADSWETTERFIDTFDSDEEIPMMNDHCEQIASQENMPDELEDTFLAPYEISFLKAALEEDYESQRRIAKEACTLTELIADSINTKAADVLGDILLEEDALGYTVIDDYKNDARSMICSQ